MALNQHFTLALFVLVFSVPAHAAKYEPSCKACIEVLDFGNQAIYRDIDYLGNVESREIIDVIGKNDSDARVTPVIITLVNFTYARPANPLMPTSRPEGDEEIIDPDNVWNIGETVSWYRDPITGNPGVRSYMGANEMRDVLYGRASRYVKPSSREVAAALSGAGGAMWYCRRGSNETYLCKVIYK